MIDFIATLSNFEAVSEDDFLKMVGLPNDALFLGYTVHLHDTDEFLFSIGESSPSVKARTWTRDVEWALVTRDHKCVVEIFNDVATTNNAAAIVLLFDVNGKISVCFGQE